MDGQAAAGCRSARYRWTRRSISDAQDAPAVAYARPHEIEIDRYSPGLEGIPVLLSRVLMVGPTARLELEREDNSELIEAEIPAERARQFNLKAGETLLIRPRRMQVFLQRPQSPLGATKDVEAQANGKAEDLPVLGTVVR